MKYSSLAVIMLAVSAPMEAYAASPEYNYIEAGYVNADPDGFSSLDGFGIGGSFAINERFHVMADYLDVGKGPLDLSFSVLAIGYNHALTGETDFVGRIGYLHEKARLTGFGSVSDDGFMAQAGIRSMVTDTVELNGFITHLNADSSDTGISLGGRYFFTPSVSFGGGVELFEDLSVYRAGVRFNF